MSRSYMFYFCIKSKMIRNRLAWSGADIATTIRAALLGIATGKIIAAFLDAYTDTLWGRALTGLGPY